MLRRPLLHLSSRYGFSATTYPLLSVVHIFDSFKENYPLKPLALSFTTLVHPSQFLKTSEFKEKDLGHSFWRNGNARFLFNVQSTKYEERKLIGYSPEQMFKVVSQVEDYHKFVPWCVKSTVVKRNPTNYIECDLEVGFQVFVERYTSKIRLNPPNSLTTVTEDSTLFHHLESLWKFDKGPTRESCWLTFQVDFAFKSPLYKHVAKVFFEEVVKHMMTAFIGRCGTLYGPSSLSPSKSKPSVQTA